MRYVSPNACSLLFCVALAVALSFDVSLARARASSSETTGPSFSPASASSKSAPRRTNNRVERSAPKSSQPWSVADEPYIGSGAPQWRYFVEFRARNAASYGHMYVMFGEVNERHEIIKSEIAGFFPAGDERGCENCSVYYWTIGHLVPVPSEIGASDGDLEEQYVLTRFRVWLDAQQYRGLIAYINKRKANKGLWNALFANCVTFGRDVASFLNVKMPPLVAMAPSVMMYPKDLVDSMRETNGLHQEQLPLRDAAGAPSLRVGTDRQPANKAGEKVTPLSPKKRTAKRCTAEQLVSGSR